MFTTPDLADELVAGAPYPVRDVTRPACHAAAVALVRARHGWWLNAAQAHTRQAVSGSADAAVDARRALAAAKGVGGMTAIVQLRAQVAGLADSMLTATAAQLEAEPMSQEQPILYSVVAVELSKRHHRNPQAIAARVKNGEPLLDAATRP